jgi:zinc and cadmium transporter
MLILWVLAFSLLGSIGATAGAGLLLVLPDVVRGRLLPDLSSYSRTKAFVLNTLSAAATLPGALLACFWLEDTRTLVP